MTFHKSRVKLVKLTFMVKNTHKSIYIICMQTAPISETNYMFYTCKNCSGFLFLDTLMKDDEASRPKHTKISFGVQVYAFGDY